MTSRSDGGGSSARRPAPAAAAKRGWLVLQTDGASRGNPGPAAIGAVAMDPDSGEVYALGRRLSPTTNNVAEYTAVIEALKLAQRLGAESVLLEADSELLVKQLEGRYKVKSEHLAPLHEEALALLQSFTSYRLAHIPREQNALADSLANRALDLEKRRQRR